MDPNVFAAIGGVFIGLIAGAAGCLRSILQAAPAVRGASYEYFSHTGVRLNCGCAYCTK